MIHPSKESSGTMGSWKSKKSDKRTYASHTAGKDKQENCKATVMDRYFAKRARSYKHPRYGEWCRKCDGLN